MNVEKYKGTFCRLLATKQQMYFGTITDVKPNLVIMKTSQGKIETFTPNSLLSITPNGDVE